MLSMATREALAAEAFAYTARYDTAISRWFAEKARTSRRCYVRAYEKVVDLPYGENPHQRAAYYSQIGRACTCYRWCSSTTASSCRFNNLLDLDAARALNASSRSRLRDRQAQQPVRRRLGPGRSRPTGGPSRATR